MKQSTKKQIAAAIRAVNKQKKLKELAVNKKEQEMTISWGKFSPLRDLVLSVQKTLEAKWKKK